LVARSGTRGMKVTVWSWSSVDGIGPYAVDLLRSLGYRATMKVRGDDYFNAVLDSRTRAQAGFFGWYADYPAASDFFRPNFSCASFLRNSPANGNAAQFCDPSIDRQMKQALAMQATDPQAARRLWEGVDRQTVDLAPWLPLVNPKIVDVLSRRVHNYQYSPANGVLVDQLRLR
jgi:peptide/nickel transport system substrate-binding protein